MLINTVKENQTIARKSGDKKLAQLLTTFYSEAAMIGKNAGERLTTDKEVQAVAKKFIKNANEVMVNLPDSDARYAEAVFEIVCLTEYLPQQKTEEELTTIIDEIIQSKGLSTMKDMGIVMKELKSAFDGQYDGKTASQLIKELL